MIRRWIIRLPFLLALAFVVGVWVTSYFGGITVCKLLAGRMWEIYFIQGQTALEMDPGSPFPDSPLYFYFDRRAIAKNYIPLPTTLGFYKGHWPGFDTSVLIAYPLWLPTVLLAGLNWFVWRKTRAKYNGRGFPVEPVAAKDQGAAESPRGA
jgi:hypothetical protein